MRPTARILIVEDNPQLLHVLSTVAYRAGLAVYRARNLREAISLFDGHDAVLLDLCPQDGDGAALLARARSEGWSGRLAVLTGRTLVAAERDRLKELAPERWFVKPNDLHKVLMWIHELSESRGAGNGYSARPSRGRTRASWNEPTAEAPERELSGAVSAP